MCSECEQVTVFGRCKIYFKGSRWIGMLWGNFKYNTVEVMYFLFFYPHADYIMLLMETRLFQMCVSYWTKLIIYSSITLMNLPLSFTICPAVYGLPLVSKHSCSICVTERHSFSISISSLSATFEMLSSSAPYWRPSSIISYLPVQSPASGYSAPLKYEMFHFTCCQNWGRY